jgi:hypothetical protein
MSEKLNAQIGQEETKINENKGLVVAPKHDIVDPDVMLGLEGLGVEDIASPQIKLTQALSDAASNGNASPGEWFNSLSGQSYGTSFEFIPISVRRSRTLFAENRENPPICRSADGFVSLDGYRCKVECPHDRAWDWKDGMSPLCKEAYKYLVLPTAETFPATVTLMKSSLKKGKALNTLMIAARCPAWYWIYEFYSVRESNQKGSYFVAAARKKVEGGKPIPTDEAMRETAAAFYRMMKSGRIDTEEENEGFSTEPPF